MTRKILIVAISLLAMLGSVPVAARAEYAYFSTIPDLPLMPGLYEISEEGVIFDKAEGRITESMAVTKTVSAESIRAFYAQTLPQLGWQESAPGRYIRGSEILLLEIRREQDMHTLYVSVLPGER